MLLRIFTLCDNVATFGYTAEWGLAVLVDTGSFRFLLDTGMTDIAARNAVLSHTNLTTVDAIILSHGHCDHTGGLKHILPLCGSKPVYAHPDIFRHRFTLRHPPRKLDISLPDAREKLEALGARFELIPAFMEIAKGIFISSEVPMSSHFEKIDEGLVTPDSSGELVPDPLRDDLSVAVSTPRGLFVFSGCAHRGIINIVRHFQVMTGESRIYGILGGLHLSRADDEHIAEVETFLRDTDVRKVACSHCTGVHASCKLHKTFPDRFIFNASGKKLVFNID
jgi:7,8-dihydropterin-6-yl-methyl-4-(beta-D-ribofuranosyl)aminobenzene 5'-phosphate synthase